MKYHMFMYSPDGSIKVKTNICSCEKCLIGEFMNCDHEKGYIVQQGTLDNSDEDTSSSSDDECEENDLIDEIDEEYELRAHNVYE